MPTAPVPRAVILPLADQAATEGLALILAKSVRQADVLALSGPLGIGKTVLARAFIRALTRPDEEVPSPTFTLAQTYPTEGGLFWHLDLYRLDQPDEVWELGFEEALSDRAVLIEWPERLGPHLPADRLDVALTQGDVPDARIATLTARGKCTWLARAGLVP